MRKHCSDNKMRLVTDDIMDVVTIMDEGGLLNNFPTFVASNVKRVPKMKLEDLDPYIAAKKLESLESKMKKIEEIMTIGSSKMSSSSEPITSRIQDANTVQAAADNVNEASFASPFVKKGSDGNWFQEKPKFSPLRKSVGTNKQVPNTKVGKGSRWRKGMASRHVVACFYRKACFRLAGSVVSRWDQRSWTI